MDTWLNTGTLMALLVLAAWQDCRTYRISNVLTFGGAVLAVCLSLLLPVSHGPLSSLAGWGVGLLFLLPLYALGVMGAGDVKLLAMAGAFTGAAAVLVIGLYTLLAGGILAVMVAVWRGRLNQTLRNVQSIMVLSVALVPPSLPDEKVAAGRLPYGVAILAGTLVWWWRTAA
ncbi:MAG TPA: prepilin peptidase [Moraxellaceae bacterium]|nr:prepilin peptidase [Moraxellaceae bacterium]